MRSTLKKPIRITEGLKGGHLWLHLSRYNHEEATSYVENMCDRVLSSTIASGTEDTSTCVRSEGTTNTDAELGLTNTDDVVGGTSLGLD